MFTSQDPDGFNAGQTNFYMRTGDEPVSQLDPSGLGLFLQDVSTAKAQQFWNLVAAEAQNLNQSWGMTGAVIRAGGRLDFNPEDEATIAKILQERGHLLDPWFAEALRAAISNRTYRVIDFNGAGELLVAEMVRRPWLGLGPSFSLDADVTPWSFPLMYGYVSKYTGRTIAGSGEYHYVAGAIAGLFAEVTVEIRLAQLAIPCLRALLPGAGLVASRTNIQNIFSASTQTTLERSTVQQWKEAMLKPGFNWEALQNRIGGYFYQGNYYIGEGHHRMEAALQIYEETGNRSFVDRLLQFGYWDEIAPPFFKKFFGY